MWQVLRSALYSISESVLPSHKSQDYLANLFGDFFLDKITKIRDSFSSTDSFRLPAPSDLLNFDFFKTVSDEKIHKAILKSPTKSYKILNSLIVNCLKVPFDFKKAVVTPLIEKASLPPDDFKNYQLVSGLCFISKVDK